MNKRGVCSLITALLLFILPLQGCARDYGDTDEYRAFVKTKALSHAAGRTEIAEDHQYVLDNGALSFFDLDGTLIWRSDPYWFVDDFRLFDVDGDGNIDCLFSLWKSYRFYKGYDENDDPSVKNHLFLYTIRGEYAKALWASSNLPRPIYSFEIGEGTPTPVSTGAVLQTIEGEYTPDYSKSAEQEFLYSWQGWGFVPDNPVVPDGLSGTNVSKISLVGDLMVHQRQLCEACDTADHTYGFDSSFEDARDYIAFSRLCKARSLPASVFEYRRLNLSAPPVDCGAEMIRPVFLQGG